MHDKGMVENHIVNEESFINMPATSRLLFYDLSVRASKSGFVENPRKIMRATRSSLSDLEILIAKKFIRVTDSGNVVINRNK